MRKLEVKLGDLTVEGVFAAPAFAMYRPPELHQYTEQIYKRLVNFGVTLNDVSFGNVGSLGERNVLATIPRHAAAVKFTLSKLEIGFNDLLRVTFADVAGIARTGFDVLTNTDTSIKFGTFVTSMGVHGTPEGGNARAFLSPYFGKAPADLGEMTGSAAGFYYGAKERRTYLTIIVDNSAIVPDALFIRIIAGYDGAKITVGELIDVGRETFRSAFAALGLTTDLDLGQ